MPDSPSAPPITWTKIIVPARNAFDISWRELWAYRDLIRLLAKRDISAGYMQTVLGPFWFILQPILTTAVFSFLFGRMAKMGTENIPHFLFYMSGLMAWGYFAECVNKTSMTFLRNAPIFSKVYFPRLAVPFSIILTNLLGFLIQLGIFLVALAFYMWKGAPVHPNWRIVLLPALLIQMAMLGIGTGCIVASLTTRYRDLSLGVGFGVQLWMYASSIVFPISRIAPDDRWIFYLNPMVPVVESFRFAFLGTGLVEPIHLIVSFGVSLCIMLLGLSMFHRTEQTAMDAV